MSRLIWLAVALAACTNEPIRTQNVEQQEERREDQERKSGGGRDRDEPQGDERYQGDQPTNTPSPATPGEEYAPEPQHPEEGD